MRQLYFLLCVLAGYAPLHLFAQNNPCDSILIVAQATGGTMTCEDPTVNLVGALHPSALSYSWTGPNGFSSNQRIAQTVRQGSYQLVVTGINGCTATAVATVIDICTTASSAIIPPECDNNGEVLPAETCEQACVFKCLDPTNSGQPYFGSTAGWIGNDPPFGFCGVIHNDQWLAFMALSTTLTLVATSNNCNNNDGIQIAIYDDCFGQPLACEGAFYGPGVPIYLTVNNLILGKAYYILIDGYSGDECDFELRTNPPGQLDKLCNLNSAGCPPGIDCFDFDTISISGPTSICPGGTATYGINTPNNALISGYQWTGPVGTLIDGNPVPFITYPPNGKHPQITFSAQSGTICVRTLTYFFPPSVPLCIDVGFVSPYETYLPDTTICAEDTPYTTPWGQDVFVTGNYLGILSAYNGCDSIIHQKVKVLTPIVKNITRNVCAGGCVNVCGTDYCTTGVYIETCDSYQGCDSTIVLNLRVLAPVAEIIGGGVLSCTLPSLQLNSAVSPNTPFVSIRTWRNLQTGAIIGTGPVVNITQPGTYTMTTVMSASDVQCVASDTIVITGDLSQPSVLPVATPITSCTMPEATLSATSNVPGATFQWTGAGGFSAFGPTQTVFTAGTYSVRVTDPATGCSSLATVVVQNNAPLPSATIIPSQSYLCIGAPYTLSATSDVPNATYKWGGPTGFVGGTNALQNIQLLGNYTVTVTNPANGCTATASRFVSGAVPPGATITSLNNGDCANPQATLTATSNASTATYFWSGPNGFSADGPVQTVATAGTYSVTVSISGLVCTSEASVVVTLNNSTPITVTGQDDTLNCYHPVLNLVATSNAAYPIYMWEPIGIGRYYVVVVTDSLTGCTATDTISITQNTVEPDLYAEGATINCRSDSFAVLAISTTADVQYTWTGPNGFTSDMPAPAITEPGMYAITVLDPINGCTTSAAVTALDDTAPPNLQIIQQTPACGDSLLVLHAISNTPDVEIFWTAPDGYTDTSATILVPPAIPYTALAIGPNGCTTTLTMQALAAPLAPIVTAIGDTTTCEAPIAQLTAISNMNGSTFAWTGPNGFTSALANPQADSAGIYFVTVTTPANCAASATALVVNGCVVDIATLNDDSGDLKIFPVPSTGWVTLEIAAPWQTSRMQIELFDAAGKQVWTSVRTTVQQRELLDLGQLPSGTYAIRIRGKDRTWHGTVVLTR